MEDFMPEAGQVQRKASFENNPLAVYLRQQIDALSSVKSLGDIAKEAGYDRPNILSMFKRGEARVPLDKIPALARALNVDPAYMFRLGLHQFWPDAQTLAEVLGGVTTRNDQAWLAALRETFGEENPEPTPERIEALRRIFSER